MMRTGQSRRRDQNEAAIVAALRAIGVTVLRVSGAGCPALLCFHWREGWLPLEVKRATGRLTPAQADLRAQAPFCVVRSPGEALALFGCFSSEERPA